MYQLFTEMGSCIPVSISAVSLQGVRQRRAPIYTLRSNFFGRADQSSSGGPHRFAISEDRSGTTPESGLTSLLGLNSWEHLELSYAGSSSTTADIPFCCRKLLPRSCTDDTPVLWTCRKNRENYEILVLSTDENNLIPELSAIYRAPGSYNIMLISSSSAEDKTSISSSSKTSKETSKKGGRMLTR